ncbi:MAG: bifunctional folylpolyglutamate synthase/dihydrofolate synthase [Eubacteriales bacterium]|nr:bifunctional folylpolyglutamate synthase/dihydrofolate synthase [Eubacteriales bacterium]
MTYSEALKVMKNKQSLGIKPGLERIYALLEKMENPQNKLKIIHVAGTNGKGTVCSVLAKSLENQGFKVGLFTSPWVVDYREQIQINGEFISEEAFTKYVGEYGDLDATEFETVTAVVYKYFCDMNVDYAVIECGMGGAGDSTNAIPTPILSIITSVSLDHTNFLGDTLEKIAQEKAGIIKENGTAVLYPNPKSAHIFRQRCNDVGAKLIEVPDNGNYYDNDIETVKTALKFLGFDDSISNFNPPARCEYISESIMLDGAHNTDGALALEKNLPDRAITAVIGMMRDKDIDSYLKIIAPHCRRIITTKPSNDRAVSAEELKSIAEKYCPNVMAISNPLQAIKVKEYDFLLVCGSFYLARDVRKELFR